MTVMTKNEPVLLADIGGTNARFTFSHAGMVTDIAQFSARDYGSLAIAALHYLDTHNVRPVRAILAVAAALDGGDDVAFIQNPAWNFSRASLCSALGLADIRLVNDFEAIAYAIPRLSHADIRKIGAGDAQNGGPVAVMGPGTGLGAAGIVFPDGKTPHVISSEGGYVTLAAQTQRSVALFDAIRAHYNITHISAERIVSGEGIENIFRAIGAVDGKSLPSLTAADITAAAQDGSCASACETVDLFCGFLGTVAGNLALTYGAQGGVYIAGGIVPKLGPLFDSSPFRSAFVDKGRAQPYLEAIPTFVVTHPFPAFEGLSTMAGQACCD